MAKQWLTAVTLFASMAMVGCGGGSSTTQPAPTTQSLYTGAPIPPDSPFAKITEGMQEDQVIATLGQPTYRGAYVTGKAWIPFYGGGDKVRQILRYKGMGYILMANNSSFTSGYTVIEVHYDTTEPGFDRGT